MMQGKSGAGQSTENTGGESSWLVANILGRCLDGWDGHYPLDHHCSIGI